ncbi:MAG: hypothetical protein JNM14_10205 [Ferruginibacter sp.]|nr:hypothetical protein [Ferruginibacter sp.]
MQNLKQLFLLVVCIAAATVSTKAQTDSTGLPGDNFSLQGALEMFKQSASIEEFEKKINTESNNVNNLDLDGNGEIDYVKVIDKADKDVHAFILQVAVSESENQDIAVIELEKTGDTTALLQIIGDDEMYGEQTIVEASDEGDEIESDNDGKGSGPSFNYNEASRIVVNVFFWPSVRFVYRPAYVPWVSPWRWGHYPGWWRPWRPFAWHVFHPRRLVYHRHFAVVRTHRVVVAHRVYTPFRASSTIVRTRTTVARNNYKVTRTRTRVTGPRGNTRVRTNTTIQKRGGRGDDDRRGRGRRG